MAPQTGGNRMMRPEAEAFDFMQVTISPTSRINLAVLRPNQRERTHTMFSL
jgi:hypothetical protein